MRLLKSAALVYGVLLQGLLEGVDNYMDDIMERILAVIRDPLYKSRGTVWTSNLEHDFCCCSTRAIFYIFYLR